MASDPNTLLNGTVADANDVQDKFDELFSNIDNSNISADADIDISKLDDDVANVDLSNVPGAPPVGSIIPFYDFDDLATFDSDYWAYCDGSTISDGDSPLDGETLPDLSGRYLVGFGTDGGGDIDSASWATAAVGNVDHELDLSHTHTGPSHTHDLSNHTHNLSSHTHDMGNHSHAVSGTSDAEASHTHDAGGLYAYYVLNFPGQDGVSFIAKTVSSWDADRSDSCGTGYTANTGITEATQCGGTSGAGSSHLHTISFVSGTTGSGISTGTPSNNTSGAPSSNSTSSNGTGDTGTSLSSTEDIQPSSIRVRYIMRKR